MSIKLGIRGSLSDGKMFDWNNGKRYIGQFKTIPITEEQHERIQKIQRFLLDALSIDVQDMDISMKAMEIGLSNMEDIMIWERHESPSLKEE